MSTLRIGSLFSGYGGLDLGVQQAIGGQVVWHSEIDPNASKILATHWPDTPNLGDITQIDWQDVPPVDILTGGFPCQDLSTAGARKGLSGARSGLWSIMADAIHHLQPRLVVIENVAGILSAPATSDVEPCPWCVGDAPGESAVRALGAVLADLADLGFDAEWTRLGASDVGAPHRRHRIFITAWPTGHPPIEGLERATVGGVQRGEPSGTDLQAMTMLPTPTATYSGNTPEEHLRKKPGRTQVTDLRILTEEVGPLPTPRASRGASTTETMATLPTPRATEGTHGGPNQRGSKGDLTVSSAVHRPFGKSTHLATRIHYDTGPDLLRTPCAQEAGGGPLHPDVARERNQTLRLTGQVLAATGNLAAPDGTATDTWGKYAPAITRWEQATGRTAPAPTEPNDKGQPRLSPKFVEFMMGLEPGHVTDTGISRVAQLTALGNGVVPQQAAAAIRLLLERSNQ